MAELTKLTRAEWLDVTIREWLDLPLPIVVEIIAGVAERLPIAEQTDLFNRLGCVPRTITPFQTH